MSLLKINPTVPIPSHWWILVAVLAVVGIAALVAAVVMSRRRDLNEEPRDDVAQLSAECLTALDELSARLGKDLSPREACQQASRLVRRFIGLVSTEDADYLTASDLSRAARREPRLQPAAEFSEHARDACFGPQPSESSARHLIESGQEVVASWH
ncbi:hypothetical protein O6R08_08345 [Cutibacterium equinum]|uniref:Uncharacterized protein n=1 Tax=Cutibacterium equinum TaxID=3016342 RepID=A0ABY7QZ22_9ACTN|nr:hypothetical protein [Cutibacterium equinum]WCC79517.1 hypothetical protein O6R08_08345 [Cutibacterium equinum]